MRLSLQRLWLVLALGLPALLALLVPLPAVDLAYQVRAGNEILAAGRLPAVDTWTLTVAGQPWLDQQWLAQVLLAGLHGAGGWEGLAVLRAVLVSAATGLLALALVARGLALRPAAVIALLAFMLAAPAMALRPQLFGIVIFVGLLVLVALRHRRPALFPLALLLIALWANLHGSFVLGPLVLGYAWLDDLARSRPAWRSLAMAVLGALATLANPYGAEVWTYAAGLGTNPEIAGRVSEWQRTSPFTAPGFLFYVSAGAVLGLVLARRRRLGVVEGLWLAGWFLVGAWAERGAAWWPFAAAFVLPPLLVDEGPLRAEEGTPRRPAPPARASRLNSVLAVALGAALLVALPWWRPSDPLTGRQGLLSYAPSDLALRLREVVRPGDRVFVPQTWASWFEWAVPEARYFIDSRFELFPARVWRDYESIEPGGPSAAAVLADASVRLWIQPLDPRPSPWPPDGWEPVATADEGVILERSED